MRFVEFRLRRGSFQKGQNKLSSTTIYVLGIAWNGVKVDRQVVFLVRCWWLVHALLTRRFTCPTAPERSTTIEGVLLSVCERVDSRSTVINIGSESCCCAACSYPPNNIESISCNSCILPFLGSGFLQRTGDWDKAFVTARAIFTTFKATVAAFGGWVNPR